MRILFVCLGNICRSPTAEGVLRQLLTTQAPQMRVEIDSAGTSDYHIGAAPDARSQRAARARNVDLGALRARQVCDDDFRRFDLILAMDKRNLIDLRRLQPRDSTARIQLFMDFAQGLGEEVPDPYDGSRADFDAVLDMVTAASLGLIRSLSGTVIC
jgi:protein-tyrosine phosphatase